MKTIKIIQLATLALAFAISACSNADEPTKTVAEETCPGADKSAIAAYETFLARMEPAYEQIEKGINQGLREKSLDDHAGAVFQNTQADYTHLRNLANLLIKLENALADQKDKTATSALTAGLDALAMSAAVAVGSMGFADKNEKFNQTMRNGNAMAWEAIAELMLAAKVREASLGIDAKAGKHRFQVAADMYRELARRSKLPR